MGSARDELLFSVPLASEACQCEFPTSFTQGKGNYIIGKARQTEDTFEIIWAKSASLLPQASSLRPQASVIALLLLMCASGTTLPNWHRGDEILPAALPPTPTLEQITGTINANTNLVQSDRATGKISVPGARSIPVSVALERPLRFRLRAATAITDADIDIGSNDEMFWFWTRREQPAALYFCRHDQFFASSARSIFPVAPDWIMEALGLVRIRPGQSTAVDVIQRRRSARDSIGADSPGRQYQQANDRRYENGVVLEQHLYDARGTLIASAFTSHHHRDTATTARCCRKQIRIEMPATQLDLSIDLDEMQVNSLGPAKREPVGEANVSGLSGSGSSHSGAANGWPGDAAAGDDSATELRHPTQLHAATCLCAAILYTGTATSYAQPGYR